MSFALWLIKMISRVFRLDTTFIYFMINLNSSHCIFQQSTNIFRLRCLLFLFIFSAVLSSCFRTFYSVCFSKINYRQQFGLGNTWFCGAEHFVRFHSHAFSINHKTTETRGRNAFFLSLLRLCGMLWLMRCANFLNYPLASIKRIIFTENFICSLFAQRDQYVEQTKRFRFIVRCESPFSCRIEIWWFINFHWQNAFEFPRTIECCVSASMNASTRKMYFRFCSLHRCTLWNQCYRSWW